MTNTLVLGVGNPILTDDSVGLKIVRQIQKQVPKATVKETSNAGLSLLEEIAGFDHLIIVDSIKTGEKSPGELWRLTPLDLGKAGPFISSHGIGIAGALELGNKLGYDIPQTIKIYAVEIVDNSTFNEECTQEVERAICSTAEVIIKENIPENF